MSLVTSIRFSRKDMCCPNPNHMLIHYHHYNVVMWCVGFLPVLSLSYMVLLSVSGFVSTQPQFLFFLGLPSHAFSRNYYCRFCSFNTTKSKVHLYHLVDVHGVDYKIFSCDRCDYASRWKCKVFFVYIIYLQTTE